MRLLLVEDDALLGDGLRAGLALDGYSVDWVRDGEAARLALFAEEYAACVLDLGLPRRDGLAVLKDLRGRGKHTPVLILTARDTIDDKVAGLDAGADDYLLKPVDLAELRARLRALLRRATCAGAPQLHHENLTLDPASKRVTLSGQAWPCRRANMPCCTTCSATRTASAPVRNWRPGCTPGARKWKATPWKSISITCARNWGLT